MSKYVDGNGNTKRKYSNGKDSPAKTFGATGYVSCDLDAEDKRQLSAYIETGELGFEGIYQLVADDYYFSLKRDDNGGGFMATLIDNGSEPSLSGKRLVGRGATPSMAVASLLYKHFYKLAGDWANTPDRGSLDFG